MSEKICYCDQYKLNQILEQVEALSDIVDELRTELNHLKKISFNVNRENAYFESIEETNKIDYTSLNVSQKTYFENIGFFTRIDETHGLTKSCQVLKKESQEPIKFSTIYDSLKYFKNKIIKNIQSIRKTQSAKNIKNKCVTSSQKPQHEVCVLRKKEEQKFLKFNSRNEDLNKYTDEELDNSVNNTSFTSDSSAQTDIAVCSRQENDKKLYNCNCLASQYITENNEQTCSLSMINDDRSMIHIDRFADKLSKNHARQTFLKNKIKKYKKCSCKKQCPYELYKLPCNKYICNTLEKKNFPKFINVDIIRNNEYFTDSSPVETGINESLTSPLSVDLEVDVCNNYCDLKNVDEFIKRRKARTYIINKTNKNNLIKDFKTENELSFNTISSWRNINEKKEKIDEIGKKISS